MHLTSGSSVPKLQVMTLQFGTVLLVATYTLLVLYRTRIKKQHLVGSAPSNQIAVEYYALMSSHG